jgi:transmembrane sensor
VRRWTAAAAVVVAAVSAAAWWQFTRPPVYETDVGEQRTVLLDDGSVVRLNSRSKFSVRLEPERRGIELLEGQALFEVAKDPTRPFIVKSGDIAIRAVGTAFDVYRKQTGTVVTVVEGAVQVSLEGAGAAVDREDSGSARGEENKPLSAGQQAVVKPLGTIERREGVNVAAATSWLQRELVFSGESLGSVVDEFNRYNKRTIVLTDPSLVDLRVNAVFNSTNPEALLKFVSRYDGIQVTQTRSEIRIARREVEGP